MIRCFAINSHKMLRKFHESIYCTFQCDLVLFSWSYFVTILKQFANDNYENESGIDFRIFDREKEHNMEDNRRTGSRSEGPKLPPTGTRVNESWRANRKTQTELRMPGSNVTVESKVRERQVEEERRTRMEIQRRKRELEEQQIRQRQETDRAGLQEDDMDNRAGHTNTKQNRKGVSKKEMARKKRVKRLWMILGGEVLLLCLLLIAFTAHYANTKLNQLDYQEIEIGDLAINEGVEEKTNEYTTIALFGLDSRDVTSDKGNRSDTIIVASINNETKEVKLVSVYRDTYLELENPDGNYTGCYTKITHAYAYGGPKAAVATMNKNMDLQITEYVTVNFASLTDVVNDLGGITVNVDEAERQSVNVYLPETAQIAGMSYTPLYGTGDVTLDGLQAVTYCRIRNVGRGDIERSERQREVLSAILDKAKQSDLATLNQILDDVLPQISTSLSRKELLALMADVLEYELTETQGFPFVYRMTYAMDETLGQDLSVDIPANLENNVLLLHEFLYDANIEPIGGGTTTDSSQTTDDSSGSSGSTEEGTTEATTTEAIDEEDLYKPSAEVLRISNEIQTNTYTTPPEDPAFRGAYN